MKNRIFILVGPSASGKTTVENELIDNNYVKRVVSFTSRAIRDGEVEGVDYYFRSVEEILSLDNVLTIPINSDWIYSVSKEDLLKEYNSDLIYSCINIKPAQDMIQYIEENNLDIEPIFIYFDINKNQRIELLKKRGETDEDINTRLLREDKLSDFSVTPSLIVSDLYSAYDTILSERIL